MHFLARSAETVHFFSSSSMLWLFPVGVVAIAFVAFVVWKASAWLAAAEAGYSQDGYASAEPTADAFNSEAEIPAVRRSVVKIEHRVATVIFVATIDGSPARRGHFARQVQHARATILRGGSNVAYLLTASGAGTKAVFKPVTGETFVRAGIPQGQGALREQAAYLCDHVTGNQACVPVTYVGHIQVGNERLQGSVQEFFYDFDDEIENIGVPRTVEEANKLISKELLEHVAIFDMQVANQDRHTGDLLLLRKKVRVASASAQFNLGPIDHGCCFPNWKQLTENLDFSAWQSWPQLQLQPTPEAVRHAECCYNSAPELEKRLARMGLDQEALVTLRIGTVFVYYGIAVHKMAAGPLSVLMQNGWLKESLNRSASAHDPTKELFQFVNFFAALCKEELAEACRLKAC